MFDWQLSHESLSFGVKMFDWQLSHESLDLTTYHMRIFNFSLSFGMELLALGKNHSVVDGESNIHKQHSSFSPYPFSFSFARVKTKTQIVSCSQRAPYLLA